MNTKKIKAYYCHSWASEVDGAAKLVEFLIGKNLPGLELVNPFKKDLTEQWLQKPNDLGLAKQIVRTDLELIKECDIVFAYLPDTIGNEKYTGSYGSAMEVFFTRYVLGKPCYVLGEASHPWLMGLEVRHETTLDAMIARLKTELKL